MKLTTQIVVIAPGIAAVVYGISKMTTETTTMILPAWLIIVVVTLAACTVSIGIGWLAKHLLNSDWHLLTFTSICLITIVGIYSIVDYRPTLNIVVLPDYAGEVKLFVSNDDVERRDIPVNSAGIGYITEKDFDGGFYPKILKGKSDISKSVNEYNKGSYLNNLSDNYSFKYLSFIVPGRSSSLDWNMDDLLRRGAIDTNRLARRNTR